MPVARARCRARALSLPPDHIKAYRSFNADNHDVPTTPMWSARPVRIVSLLPSATETLFALGLGDQLVAVTHECDFPPAAAVLPIVTRSTLALENEDSAGIEASVSVAAAEGRSLYYIDTEAIRELRPDLVVAQDICRVCAVSADQVAGDLEGIRMIRQHPHSLADVLADIEELAAVCHADSAPLMAGLKARLEAASSEAGRHR